MKYIVFKPLFRPNKMFPYLIKLLKRKIHKGEQVIGLGDGKSAVLRVVDKETLEVEIDGTRVVYKKAGEVLE